MHHMFTYARNHNPKNRRSPTPRPDFAIMKNGRVVRIMDAKYKDLWENTIPRDMLYQLSVYALSSEEDKQATIIYPSLNQHAVQQRIEIHNPISGEYMGAVLLEPLDLGFLAKCLEDIRNRRKELVKYMNSFI